MIDHPHDDPNPTPRRKPKTDWNAPSLSEMVAKREEQLAALAEMQRKRPLRPPGVGR